MRSRAVAAALALASAAAAGALAWALLPRLRGDAGGGDTVVVVDQGPEVRRVLAERAEEPVAPRGGGRLVHHPIPEKDVKLLYASVGREHVADPLLHCRRPAGFVRVLKWPEHPEGRIFMEGNSLGMRDEEPAAEKPDVRVVVTGDSHVEGVCWNHESYPNVLERLLRERHPELEIEVLNAATGGWSFYNYLGALERWSELDPDAFVFTVYGGNDWQNDVGIHTYFQRIRGVRFPDRATLRRMFEAQLGPIVPQCFLQIGFFAAVPELEELAAEMADAVTEEIALQGRERGVPLLAVYLPPLLEVQPERYAEAVEAARAHIGTTPEQEAVSARLAERWMRGLDELGVPCVDLRPAFRAADEPLYWNADHHLSLAGHEVAARAVLEPLERLLGLAPPPDDPPRD